MTQRRDSDANRNQGQSGQQQGKQSGPEQEQYENLAEKGGEQALRTPGSASNVAVHFKGVDFPATKRDLLRHAEQNDAPDEVRTMIERLPDNQQFGSMADVMAAWGREKQ